MSDLTYIVSLVHKEKGIGFSAKEALQNAQKQDSSPIRKVRFLGQPTGSHTDIEVTIDDDPLCQTINSCITSSGRMPTVSGVWSVKSIEFQREGADLTEMVDVLQNEITAQRRQLTGLRDENARLRQEKPKEVRVVTPLDGLLAYFATTNYSPEFVLDDPADLDFARRVFSGDIENTFVNYTNHILGESLTKEEVDNVLNYKPKNSEELSALHSKYEAAKKELDFLVKLRSGDAEIPETLRDDYIKVIEAKGHDETIREYKSTVQEQENAKSRQITLRQLKNKYDSFSEQIDLLTQAGAELPVIFDVRKNGVNLYFPFRVRDVKSGFIGDLGKELQSYSEDSTVERLENTFLAYRVNNGNHFPEWADHLVEDTPVTLRVAGFNKIVPYRLGYNQSESNPLDDASANDPIVLRIKKIKKLTE